MGYQIIENAIIVPPEDLGDQRFDFRGGVFRPDKTFVEESVTYSMFGLRHRRPEFPETRAIQHLPGTHAFGGIFFGHFGHFVVESMGRLWVLGEKELDIESVVYVPLGRLTHISAFEKRRQLLAALGIQAEIGAVGQPTRVDRLIVPESGFGLSDDLIGGTPKYRDFMQKAAEHRSAAEGADKLYISRSKLSLDRGGFFGSALVDSLLEAEGFRIWHPQMEDPSKQIAQLMAAKKIIATDSSPLHLLAFVARQGQEISTILRRSNPTFLKYIIRHVKGFSPADVRVIDALVADHVQSHPFKPSWCELDLPKVGQALAEHGMISNPSAWHNLTNDELNAEIDSLREKTKLTFLRRPIRN